MKTRQGFVSNSSSSSFCIIGVERSWANRLAVAEGKNYEGEEPKIKVVPGCECNVNRANYCPECGSPKCKTVEVEPAKEPDYLGYGCDDGKVVRFFGGGELQYAGIDAEPLLSDMNIKEARVYFHDLIKKEFKLDIPIDKIDFYYGEVSSE